MYVGAVRAIPKTSRESRLIVRIVEYRTFGRTGLRVSVAGIGTGGHSRLGLSNGSTEVEAIALIHRGLELGVNYIDTAESYRTEELVGRALAGHRHEVLISSKIDPRRSDGSLLDRPGLRRAVEVALQRLRTEEIDVYHLHRPRIGDYGYCLEELVPELDALRAEGKIRFLGVTEQAMAGDPMHEMLNRAVQDDCWDVVMTTFNLFNQSARDRVFPMAISKGIAIEIMSAARGPFSDPELLVEVIARLVDSRQLTGDHIDLEDPLSFLSEPGGVQSLTDTSYRFAANEPGAHTVLFGTGNMSHLEENVRSLSAGKLPLDLQERLATMFGHLAMELERGVRTRGTSAT